MTNLRYFRACSQKLAAWQENGELGLEKLKLSRSAKESRESRKSKQDSKSTRSSKPEPKIVITPDVTVPSLGKPRRRR